MIVWKTKNKNHIRCFLVNIRTTFALFNNKSVMEVSQCNYNILRPNFNSINLWFIIYRYYKLLLLSWKYFMLYLYLFLDKYIYYNMPFLPELCICSPSLILFKTIESNFNLIKMLVMKRRLNGVYYYSNPNIWSFE